MPDFELSTDERELLFDRPLPPAEDENIVDDEYADFRKLSPEEQKWALIQMELDREERLHDPFSNGD